MSFHTVGMIMGAIGVFAEHGKSATHGDMGMVAKTHVKIPHKIATLPAFLPSTHNGVRKIGVVYERIMKISALSSPFWFAIHEGYPSRPLFV